MISDNLKNIRKMKGLTQKDLAEKSGITRESIGNYERGDRTPPADILNKIAIALEVSLNDLIGNEESIDITGSNEEYRNVLNDFLFDNPRIFDVVRFLESFNYSIKSKPYEDTHLISIFKNDNLLTTVTKIDFEEYAAPLIKLVDIAKNRADSFINEIDLLYGFHTK